MKLRRIIVSSVTLIAMVIGMCACGASGTNSPTAAVEKMIEATKTDDTEALKEVYSGEVEDVFEVTGANSEFLEIIDERMREFDHKCSNEQIDGDKATVDVSITTYDSEEAYLEALDEYFGQIYGGNTDTDAEKLIIEYMSKQEKKDYEKTVTIHLTKIDGKWMVDEFGDNDPYFDAINGGLISASEEIANSLGQSSGTYSSGTSSYSSGSSGSNSYSSGASGSSSYGSNSSGSSSSDNGNLGVVGQDAFKDGTESYEYDSNEYYYALHDYDNDGKLTEDEFFDALGDAATDMADEYAATNGQY